MVGRGAGGLILRKQAAHQEMDDGRAGVACGPLMETLKADGGPRVSLWGAILGVGSVTATVQL